MLRVSRQPGIQRQLFQILLTTTKLAPSPPPSPARGTATRTVGSGRDAMAATMDVAREKVVVCDNGTGFVKCGFAGDNFPRAVLSVHGREAHAAIRGGAVGHGPEGHSGRPGGGGSALQPRGARPRVEASARRRVPHGAASALASAVEFLSQPPPRRVSRSLTVGCPSLEPPPSATGDVPHHVNGAIQNWQDMHEVWRHTFHDQLRVDPRECKILLTDPPQIRSETDRR